MSNEFDFDTKNGWTHYADAASQEQMDVLAARYMDFLSHAKTERETVDLVVEALKAAGFSEDFKKDLVFRTYRGKAVFVARKGKKPLASGVRLISAHTDAPRLDFKQRPLCLLYTSILSHTNASPISRLNSKEMMKASSQPLDDIWLMPAPALHARAGPGARRAWLRTAGARPLRRSPHRPDGHEDPVFPPHAAWRCPRGG